MKLLQLRLINAKNLLKIFRCNNIRILSMPCFINILEISFWQTCPWLIIWRWIDKMWEAADQKIAKRISNRFLTMAVTSQELIFYILSTMNNEFWKIVWKVAISMCSFRPFQFPFDAIDFSFQQKIKRI